MEGADSPTPPLQFIEVKCETSGAKRRFAIGTEAGFATSVINSKLGSLHPAVYIEAIKEGEEPITFGPTSPLVDYGQSWTLHTVIARVKFPRGLEKKSKTHRKKEKKEKNRRNSKGNKDDELSTCPVVFGVDSFAKYPKVVDSSQVEKSDITEEHGLPILTDNISYLSDGTQRSANRKRIIIRFKSIPKHKDPISADDASCSEPKFGMADLKTDIKMTELVEAPNAETNVEFEKEASTSGQNMATHNGADDELHHSLIVDWVRALLQSVLNDYGDDEDWLFETKRENNTGSKRFKSCSEVVLPVCGSTNQMQWPRAHWLSEPCISALPFTVPF